MDWIALISAITGLVTAMTSLITVIKHTRAPGHAALLAAEKNVSLQQQWKDKVAAAREKWEKNDIRAGSD